MVREYREEIKERLSKKMETQYGRKNIWIIGVIVIILVNVVYGYYSFVFWGIDAAYQNMFEFFVLTVVSGAILFLVLRFYWRFYDIPEEIYIENKISIKEKDVEISELIEKGKELSPQKIAIEIGKLIQDLESELESFSSNSTSIEFRRFFFVSMGQILDDLIDWSKKARLFLEHSHMIGKDISHFVETRNRFRERFDVLLLWKEKRENHTGTNEELAEIVNNLVVVYKDFWSEDMECFSTQMQMGIDHCLTLLSKEM